MTRIDRFLGIGFALLVPARSPGQTAGASPAPALTAVAPSVRAAGLAGSGAALPGYAGTLFVNPAGIAPIRVLSLETGFARWPDHTYAMAAAATRAGKLNLGVGVRYLRLPADSPASSNASWTGALVYRKGGIALGTGTEYFWVAPREGPAQRALSGGLALQVAFFDIAALALSLERLASARLGGGALALPRVFHVAMSFNLLDTYSNGRLLATVESIWAEGDRRRTVLGLEAGAVVKGLGIVARAGTGREPGLPGGLFSHATFGGSLLLGKARLDYAYQQSSVLGHDAHWLGARWTP